MDNVKNIFKASIRNRSMSAPILKVYRTTTLFTDTASRIHTVN